MIKRVVMAVGLMAVAGLAAACSAAPGDETGEVGEGEQIATESEELPCTDCGGEGGGYEPYYPYDNACGYGEHKWNSAGNCGPDMPCSTGGTGCSTVTYRCGSNGCGGTSTSTSNPCYGKWSGCYCTTSGGYAGTCLYNWQGVLACFA